MSDQLPPLDDQQPVHAMVFIDEIAEGSQFRILEFSPPFTLAESRTVFSMKATPETALGIPMKHRISGAEIGRWIASGRAVIQHPAAIMLFQAQHRTID